MQKPAMTLIFRPGVIAVLAAATIGAALLFRHLDRGYVEFVEGDFRASEKLLAARPATDGGFASFVAGNLVASRSRGEEQICQSRKLYKAAGDAGSLDARTNYIASLSKLSSTPENCAWIRNSLRSMDFRASPLAAAEIGILVVQPSCGIPDPQLSLAYFLVAQEYGLRVFEDQIKRLSSTTGVSRQEAEVTRDRILQEPAPAGDWTSILENEPASPCPGN